jgi:hypothetical protein
VDIAELMTLIVRSRFFMLGARRNASCGLASACVAGDI